MYIATSDYSRIIKVKALVVVDNEIHEYTDVLSLPIVLGVYESNKRALEVMMDIYASMISECAVCRMPKE